MNHPAVVVLFVKPPIPGRVKTRLARDIGAEAACSIYRALVERVLQQIEASGFPLALFFDGDEDQVPDRWKRHARCCVQQQGGDLGGRMAHAFRQLFDAGYQSAVLCGSDIPGIDAAYLRHAGQALQQSGMVIAPAHDGGYCLIGFVSERFTPLVFDQIRWSTDQVLQQTLDRCSQVGLQPMLLTLLRDIDTVDDLREVAPEMVQE